MPFSRQQQRWVLAAQSGDRDALDRLLRSVQDPLFGYLVQITQDRHLAEDVLQETFLLIFRKLYWLREPSAFPAWAYRIASRQAFRALKRRRLLTSSGLDEEVAGGEEIEGNVEPLEPELTERIPGLLSQLSPASRAVISLHYLNEMTLAETADVLGLSTGTVKSRLAYGLRQLRRRLRGGSYQQTIRQ